MSQDIVRVLRVVEYEGPREWVEATVAKSIQGEKRIGPGQFIRAGTVGLYPQVVGQAGDADRPTIVDAVVDELRGKGGPG